MGTSRLKKSGPGSIRVRVHFRPSRKGRDQLSPVAALPIPCALTLGYNYILSKAFCFFNFEMKTSVFNNGEVDTTQELKENAGAAECCSKLEISPKCKLKVFKLDVKHASG